MSVVACVLQEVLSHLPLEHLGVQIISESGGALRQTSSLALWQVCVVLQVHAARPAGSLSRSVHLYIPVSHLHADNLALLADSPDDAVAFLGMADAVASKYRLFVSAAKTETMVVGRCMT
eukprot:356174-Chlamydomonas_euryale.AAC.18